MASEKGVKVVLTASATEMSDFYNSPFIAFVAGFGKGPLPLWLLRRKLYPPAERDGNGRVKYAPYGLRKVEAILLENGFDPSDVAVVHPFDLDRFVGSDTKAVGISSMDPTGMGYVSKTYSSILGGGESMNAIEFRSVVKHRSIRTYKPKVIVGGFGAWQLERKRVADRYGVDCVFIGQNEEIVAETFRKAVNGESFPHVVRVQKTASRGKVPVIRHAALHGCVEISRGCGRNCQFCTPTMQLKNDVPLQKIMDEVKLTVREGSERITLVTEDIFLYGAKDEQFVPNKRAVMGLVKSVGSYPGVKAVQPAHMSLAPVVHDPGMIKELAEILIDFNWYVHGKKRIVTSETGVETGSVRLMKKYMAGKMLPFKPEQWKEIVNQAFGILNDNDWYPLATLIVGLPDENEKDVIETLELMDDLRDYQAFYVPLLFVPLENCLLVDNCGAEVDSLTRARWEFITKCWEYNIRIWKDTFLESRIQNPIFNKIVKQAVLPFVGKIAGTYYGAKHGAELEKAVWRMVNA
jgi:radical SAM superfamily enzyme YgiQ (UPF0313 family)